MPEKELFAFVFALKKFRVYIYGRPFVWRTDTAALQWLSTAKNLLPKLLRWSLLVSTYPFFVEHISGNKNSVADALYRYPVSLHSMSSAPLWQISQSSELITPPPSTYPFAPSAFIAAQHQDPFCHMWFEF